VKLQSGALSELTFNHNIILTIANQPRSGLVLTAVFGTNLVWTPTILVDIAFKLTEYPCFHLRYRTTDIFLCPISRAMTLTYDGSGKPDPILLTLFANRFMSVAEAMGRSLQQTSISTNIKERLDYSCALFAPDGDLVANAPFIPIHLGSMSLLVLNYFITVLSRLTIAISDQCSEVSNEVAWQDPQERRCPHDKLSTRRRIVS
jgi:Hydantoinase B/oxoprolinase